MANPARDHVDAHLTHLDDLRKQYVSQREALVEDLDQKIADIDEELASWHELLSPPPAKKAAAKPAKA